MGIIAFIILGLLAGLIAKAIMPGNDPGGYIVTAAIGIVGALLGGFLAAALFGADPMDEFFDISTWLTAIIGSIIQPPFTGSWWIVETEAASSAPSSPVAIKKKYQEPCREGRAPFFSGLKDGTVP